MHLNYLNLDTCKNVFINVFDHSIQKLIFVITYCGFDYLYPDARELIAVILLLFMDLATGVIRAKKENKWKGSKGFRRTAEKFFVYLIMIAMANVVDSQFQDAYKAFPKIFFGIKIPLNSLSLAMNLFLVSTEALSILENISALGWPVPTKLIEFLKVQSSKKDEEKKD